MTLSIPWLAIAGCSDDGLAPPQNTDAGSTSAVATSLSGNEESEDPTGPQGSAGGTAAASTGNDSGTTGESGVTGTGPADGTSDGTTGTTGDPPPSMPCDDANQCVLVDDCCECAAHHMDDVIPECNVKCDQSMCTSLGIPDIGVVCEEMTCQLETHDCSGVVSCDGLPPECAEGTLPEVSPDAGCWTGACIPIEACDPLPSCEYCDETEACVATVTQLGASYSCRAIPEECMGTATCECMPDACQAPFDVCADAKGQITCECPAC